MAILIECAVCHSKQKNSNKKCSCGDNLDKQKDAKRVRYWINFRVKGKQYRQFVGYSIEEAKDADGKRRAQKRENRIFDMLPEAKMTFKELAEWYLDLQSVKGLRSYERIKGVLNIVVEHLGDRILESIKAMDLEEFIAKKKAEGKAAATIHMELAVAKMAINKALDNDLISARTLKAFRIVKGPFKTGSNARTRTMTLDEYGRLIKVAPHYLKVALTMSLYCGMRRGEICSLTWSNIDLKAGFIRLTAEQTKEGKPKVIPIPKAVKKILSETPRALHNDYVILNNGKPVFKGTFTNAVHFACRDAGIPYGMKIDGGLRLHDLRATCKTFMVKAGIDSAMRSKLLGHALQGMDKYYLRFSDADLKAAMDKYSTWLEAEMVNTWSTIPKEHVSP